MRRFLFLVGFHLKQYSQNSYFFMTVLVSTATLILLQYLAAYAQGELMSTVAWLRSGIFGLWAAGTTAAGVVGMQKWQGTLLYLINNPVSDYLSLIALVMPAAIFGLLSFPIAFTLMLLIGVVPTFHVSVIVGILLLWAGATVLDFCIAALFVLTRNAIIYEELISLPVLILSGLFTMPSGLVPIQQFFQWVIPIAIPISWVLGDEGIGWLSIMKFSVSVILTLIVSYFVTNKLIRKAKQTGQIGGIV